MIIDPTFLYSNQYMKGVTQEAEFHLETKITMHRIRLSRISLRPTEPITPVLKIARFLFPNIYIICSFTVDNLYLAALWPRMATHHLAKILENSN